MKIPFPANDLLRISWTIEIGLKSGRDWVSVMKWLSVNDSKQAVKKYLQQFCKSLQVESAEKIIREERKKFKDDILWALFFEILLQAQRGSQHLSSLFHSFSKIGYSIAVLRQKERSLLFIPKFQTWMSGVITLAFTIGLPLLAPKIFPTFLSLHRYDLFTTGVGLLAIGFFTLHLMCVRPRRLLKPMLGSTFFFYFLSIYIESGLDLPGAWYRALESVDLPKDLKTILSRQGLNVESIDAFFDSLQLRLPKPWPDIICGLKWARASGYGLSQFLKSISERESERLLFRWEDEIRKLTMTALLPLGVLVFPSTLFLLVGPQFLELIAI